MSQFSINGVKYDESQRCKKCGRIPGYPYPPWEQAPANCECQTRGKAPEMTETSQLQPHARRCGTCKFWGSDPADDDIRECDPALWARVRPCAGVKHDADDSGPYPHDLHGSTRAEVVDGSGYYASLRTREDFGCVLWEKQDAEAQS